MAVEVKFGGVKREKFEHEDDCFALLPDGKLEVRRNDGTVKIFRENSFESVDGKRCPPEL